METPVLSIIIPVYNAENYIERCLKSVISGELENIEIILINDASNDGGELILKKYASLDKRIVLINNDKNMGQGKSRNKGILFARGKYIGFIDNDDWIESNYFSSMVQKIEEEKSDICVCLKIENHKNNFSKTHLINPDDLKEIVFIQRTAFWAKIFKKEFLLKYGIKFGISRGEDIEPAFYSAYFADKISYIENSKYHCNIRKGSVSRRKITFEDFEEIRLYKRLLDFIREKEDKEYWLHLIKKRSLISFDFLYKNADEEIKKEILNEYEKIFGENCLKEYETQKIINCFEKIKSYINGSFKR